MLTRLLAGCCAMALCVIIHAGGITWALRQQRRATMVARGFWRGTWLFIRVAIWMLLLHLVEISVWAAMYVWNGAMPDAASAFYFSAVTYTTVGYGDLVLPPPWRLDAGIEALTGILMCGWSTGFFFATVNRLYERQG
jgi:Ion channel